MIFSFIDYCIVASVEYKGSVNLENMGSSSFFQVRLLFVFTSEDIET